MTEMTEEQIKARLLKMNGKLWETTDVRGDTALRRVYFNDHDRWIGRKKISGVKVWYDLNDQQWGTFGLDAEDAERTILKLQRALDEIQIVLECPECMGCSPTHAEVEHDGGGPVCSTCDGEPPPKDSLAEEPRLLQAGDRVRCIERLEPGGLLETGDEWFGLVEDVAPFKPGDVVRCTETINGSVPIAVGELRKVNECFAAIGVAGETTDARWRVRLTSSGVSFPVRWFELVELPFQFGDVVRCTASTIARLDIEHGGTYTVSECWHESDTDMRVRLGAGIGIENHRRDASYPASWFELVDPVALDRYGKEIRVGDWVVWGLPTWGIGPDQIIEIDGRYVSIRDRSEEADSLGLSVLGDRCSFMPDECRKVDPPEDHVCGMCDEPVERNEYPFDDVRSYQLVRVEGVNAHIAYTAFEHVDPPEDEASVLANADRPPDGTRADALAEIVTWFNTVDPIKWDEETNEIVCTTWIATIKFYPNPKDWTVVTHIQNSTTLWHADTIGEACLIARKSIDFFVGEAMPSLEYEVEL